MPTNRTVSCGTCGDWWPIAWPPSTWAACANCAAPHGLQLWLENYGHWGFPAEFLQYGGQSDCLGGEFWLGGARVPSSAGPRLRRPTRMAFPRVSAEAFTGGPLFQTVPSALKARGDWAFCEGINHFVLHVNIHQPWEDRVPGVNAWFGTEFNRHNTWFEASQRLGHVPAAAAASCCSRARAWPMSPTSSVKTRRR